MHFVIRIAEICDKTESRILLSLMAATFCSNRRSVQFLTTSYGKLQYVALAKKVSFHRLGICSFPPLNNDLKSIKIGIRRQNTFAMATEMYPTVKAHRTAHWLWVQSWQDHIFRVTSFTKQQCKHFFFLEPDRDNIIKNIPLS